MKGVTTGSLDDAREMGVVAQDVKADSKEV